MLLVSIPRPVALTPSIDEIIDPRDDVANKIEFNWKESKWAASYLVSVYSEGALVASAEPTENRVVIELPHKKVYRWSVVPRLSTSKTREPASTYEPDAQDGTFTIGEYVKLNLAGSEEPSQLYAWTRFIYSDVAYMSDNFDQNSRIRQSVLVSSAEVAGGYWYRKTDYGGLVSAQISGIDIGGKTGSFNQYSALLGYRMELSEQRRLRFWIGPSIKETPELVPNGFTRSIDVRSIKTLGASALVAFFNSFTENFGLQVYGGSFYGMKGLDTPNGLDQKSFISFFASLYGTYKVSKNMTSLLGVTYQSDTAGYKSADRSGNDNRVLFAGNYISLSFIFGLQEPEK